MRSGRAVYEVLHDEEFTPGELVVAKPYWLDNEKITVLARLNGEADLSRNLYHSQVVFIDYLEHLSDLDHRTVKGPLWGGV
ncbi:hypothetical protein [Nesterenkonia rhizosphaerae]|uniref:Uncharacterized protein n=1 Tax=Nesterenkonia rhizosphaerae TaxID=1348272 RepID=A0ABP9FZM1_9MICC